MEQQERAPLPSPRPLGPALQSSPRCQPRPGGFPGPSAPPSWGHRRPARGTAPLPHHPLSLREGSGSHRDSARTAPCESPGRPPPRGRPAPPHLPPAAATAPRPGPVRPRRPCSPCPRPAAGTGRRPRMRGAGEGPCGDCGSGALRTGVLTPRPVHGPAPVLSPHSAHPLPPALLGVFAHTLPQAPAPTPAPTAARRVPLPALFPACPASSADGFPAALCSSQPSALPTCSSSSFSQISSILHTIIES